MRGAALASPAKEKVGSANRVLPAHCKPAAAPSGARRRRRRLVAATPQQAAADVPDAQQEQQGPPNGVDGDWSEELQKEFEAYQAQTPVGGYYPVLIGELFGDGRYTVLGFLGQGHYSTVWRVLDAETGEHCAMKVVKSAEAYTEAARDEVALLAAIRERDPSDTRHCVRLLDTFEHPGPHGIHVCEVFAGVMGDDLLALIRAYKHRGMPLSLVRHVTRQALVALDYLHSECGIIHTDVKPENVMLTDTVLPNGVRSAGNQPFPDDLDLQEMEERLLRAGCKLVDFGNACWTHLQFSDVIQTRQYRAPEVILGAPYGAAADIWSLGCLVWELATGQYLLNPRTVGTRGRDRDHLTQMMQRLGHIPRSVATSGRHASEFFSAEGRLWHLPGRHVPHWPLDRALEERHGMPTEEAIALGSFLTEMLHFDPARRSTAAQLLEHPFLNGQLPMRPSILGASPSAFWGAGAAADGAAVEQQQAATAAAAEGEEEQRGGLTPARQRRPESVVLAEADGVAAEDRAGEEWAEEQEAEGSPRRSASPTPAEGYRHHSPPGDGATEGAPGRIEGEED